MAVTPLARTRTVERVFSLEGAGEVRFLEAIDVDTLLARAIHESAPPPYGAVLWASGVALAHRLAGRAALLGKTVVDVGAGVGLCSLVAARLGARVIALDHDEVARALLTEAAARQGLDVQARAFDLYDEGERLPPADLVLFADVLYEDALARAAARRVLEALAAGSEVLVADPERLARAEFLAVLEQGGVEARFDTCMTLVPGDEASQKVGVLALCARRA